MPKNYSLTKISDHALLSSLTAINKNIQQTTAEHLAHIAEVDHRKLYRQQACSSMFVYCTERLGLSEAATAKRIHVARAARRWPVLFDYVAAGKVHLAGAALLAPHLTDENHRRVLERACRKSKRQIEHLVAELSPQPDVASSIRRLPAPKSSAPAAKVSLFQVDEPTAVTPQRPQHRPIVAPLAPHRYKVQFTADTALHQKIAEAQVLMRHTNPTGDITEVFDAAMTLLVAKLKKQRFGATKSPRKSRKKVKTGSRHVPAAVKRAVHARDQGQCSYCDAKGRRCSARGMLEYDHIEPFARGGPTTADNLRLRCRAHNTQHAEDAYGKLFMRQARLL